MLSVVTNSPKTFAMSCAANAGHMAQLESTTFRLAHRSDTSELGFRAVTVVSTSV